MGDTRIKLALPYLIGLAVAGALFVYAGNIQYSARPGHLGPDFWPKLAIGLMAAACVFEIVRIFSGHRAVAKGVEEAFGIDDAKEEKPPVHQGLVAGGIGLVLAYAVLVSTLGFLLSTFVFLAAFMYLGRYRNHIAIWSVSVVMTFLIASLFLRFAYVSLPRGAPPFDRITDYVGSMLGG